MYLCVILRLTLRMEMREQKRLNKKRYKTEQEEYTHCTAAIAGPCRAELGGTHLAIAGCLVAGVGCPFPSLYLSFSLMK